MAPVRIVVFGATGAGKTSFVNQASGANMTVGNGANSETKEVHRVKYTQGRRDIEIVDLPGFNDTELEDPLLFEKAAAFFKKMFEDGEQLNGLLFLQSVSTVRVETGERKAMELFLKIIGPAAYKNVIVASTMWDVLRQDFATRNEGNRNDLWSALRAGGAGFAQFLNTRESARGIVEKFMNKPQISLQLQKELDSLDGDLFRTTASRFLQHSLVQKLEDVNEQTGLAGNTSKLKSYTLKLKGWLKKLSTATFKALESAWRGLSNTLNVAVEVMEIMVLAGNLSPF